MKNKQAERERQLAKLYGAVSPDVQAQIMELMRKLVTRNRRQADAIKQAVEHATFAQVSHGSDVVNGLTLGGRSVFGLYRDQPYMLAGIAFVAGVAEGKQAERNRQYLARLKNARKAGRKS